jgi:eukaryotic-like serine/threonine-protein kinase
MDAQRRQRIEEFYQAALKLEPDKRSAFLMSGCPDDEEVRRGVESLLSGPATEVSGNPPADSTKTIFNAGQRLGTYEILGLLGVGGMGEVYKALDTRLNRPVAIKLILAEMSNATARRRFEQETKTASSLNHPHIVTVHEAGESEGRPYLVTEYVDGGTLRRWVKLEKRPVRQTLELLLGVADGLACAHEAGILHRDIKPENVLVSRSGYAKLADFGLAKVIADANGENDPHTLTEFTTKPGTILGTLVYMPPEHLQGEPVDVRADIFSFGVLLYEVFTGALPFEGKTKIACMRAILDSEPAAPSALVPGFPRHLETSILRCLEKQPAKRFQTARELASALRADLDAANATEQAVAASIETKRRQRKLVAWSAAIVASLVIAASIPAVRRAVAAYLPARSSADPPSNAKVTDTLPPAQSELFLRAKALLQRYDRKGNVDKAIETFQSLLNENPSNAGAYAALAQAYVRKNALSPDAQWLKLAAESARRAIELNGDLADAHVAMGMAFAASGKNTEASTELQKATDLDSLSVPAMVALAEVRAAQARNADAESLFHKSIEAAPADWIPFTKFGTFLYRNGRYAEAADIWSKGIQITPDNVILLPLMAAAYHMLDRYAEAGDTLQRALELDPGPRTWANLGTARFFEGRYSDAVRADEKAVELVPNNYLYWGNLGDAYRWAPGQHPKAGAAYTRAIQLVREKLAANPNNPEMRGSLIVYLAKSGDKAGAIREAGELQQAPGNTPGTKFKIALGYEIAGKRDDALRTLASAMEAHYSIHEISTEPELASLRTDVRYHRLVAREKTSAK